MTRDIKNYSFTELEKAVTGLGLAAYNTKQIFAWLYQKGVEDFSGMSDLSRAARSLLAQAFDFSPLRLLKEQTSCDGTKKFLFGLEDGAAVETVFIPEEKRATLCISTQVGCKYACRFCVSGRPGFTCDLTSGEIVGQLLAAQKITGQKITNVVFMGIGEPLDNFDNVVKAIGLLCDRRALGIPKHQVCLSTCGLVPQIQVLAALGLGIKLSISLHAADDIKRSQIMPVNKKYPLKELIAAAQDYARQSRHPVTFEYVLLKDFNSSPQDAQRLARLLKGFSSKVNLIPCNEGPAGFTAAAAQEAKAFADILKASGVTATVRRPRGQDIAAACGQLKAQHD